MSYIGENVAVADFSKQTFTANSSTTVFVLSSSVANSSCLIVSVGGVIQEPDVAYTASGTTLTFSVAPTTGNDVYVIYIGKELPKTTHGDNTITNALIPDGSITSDKIQSLAPSKLTGALPAIDGSALTGVGVNTDSLEDNIAMLGFKLASNNSLAKYNLVDRTIDEYQDATGIDASTSTGEVAGGAGTGKYYIGYTAAIPAATQGNDHSASNHTITESTAAQYSTTQKMFGTHGMSFASQHISAAASSDFLFTGDFTIEMWLRYDTLPGNYYHFNIGPLNDFAFKGYSGMMQFISAGQTILQPSGAFATNTWNHWALVRSGSTCTIYKDGTSLGTGTKAGTIGSSTTGVTLGYGPGAQVPFDGWLDEVRISDVARYTSNFAVATSEFVPDSNTKLLLHGNAVAEVPASTGMNLISTSTTASTAPTKGDITVLIEDNLGTATINTDIKGYVSRNGGTGWDQGTLIHEGTWGTNRKVLSFHDQTFSNSASGTDMKYKIETANQSYTAGTTQTVAKSHTGANQTWTVPAGVTSITFTGWGGGGGGSAPGVGGGGGYISGPVTVIPGETLNVKVGSGGLSQVSTGGGGSGGGGGTGIYRGATVLAIAGGGGGGVSNQRGGAGGGLVGEVGYDTRPGQGGTQSAGGAAAQRTNNGGGTTPVSGGEAGSLNQAGHACNGSGSHAEAWNSSSYPGAYNGGGKGGGDLNTYTSSGGGGGYYGGSGGGMGGNGSGGGGSSLTTGTNTQATGQSTPQTSHANYVAGVGNGGAASSNGGNGHAVITYTTSASGKQTRIHATSLAWS